MSEASWLGDIFARAGARGFVHVPEIGRTDGIDLDADAPVAVASVVKVLVALTYAKAVDSGQVDPGELIAVPSRYRIGGTGTAGCSGPVSMTLADLALFMMSVSDNAATDVIFQRLGHSAICDVVSSLGDC